VVNLYETLQMSDKLCKLTLYTNQESKNMILKILFRLTKLIAPLLPVMLLAVIFGTLGFICAISIPVFGIFTLFQVQKTGEQMLKFLVLIGILRGIFHYLEQYCNHFIAFTILARIRSIVFKKLRELGPAKLETNKKGNLIAILTSDIELLELFYAHTISPVCIAFFVNLICLIFMTHFSLFLSFIAFAAYFFISVLIPLSIQKKSVKLGTNQREAFSSMNSFLLDLMYGLRQTILYGMGEKRHFQLAKKSEELSKIQGSLAKHEGNTSAFIESSVLIFDIIMLAASVILFSKNLIDFKSMILCNVLLFSSFGPSLAVARLGVSLSKTFAAAKRIILLLDEKPVISETKNSSELKDFFQAQLENVSFSYKTDLEKNDFGNSNSKNLQVPILSNVNIKFGENEIIGIQGKSGCGKSTILKLLMRFYDVNSGKIKITASKQNLQELDIKEISLDSLKKTENYVSQETVLFHDTIENNIKIAKLNASREEIENACKKASIHEFIVNLPDGYKTQISEFAENFSSGERQRLGLARAFLHGGKFMLLDEPTSNLDSFNEKIILDSVFAERKNKTIALVSHRASTLKICDSIYKIENGRNS